MNMLTKFGNLSRSPSDPRVVRSGPTALTASDMLASKLGWFSIALGVAELAASQRIARALGMRGRESIIRAYGAREVSSGILSLSVDKQAGLWSRVAGDALDIATLLPAFRRDNPKRDNVGLALVLIAGVTLIDWLSAQKVSARHARGRAQPQDFSNRSGFPRGVAAVRGLARTERSTSAGQNRCAG
ncbi:hypothetical protein NKI48_31580 [Mesorhizobium sp. M0644]|uniref:hypothetical protein n=1 Tax=unclassified Mesorhizobium TaxID=325217 RepID=UPI00333A5E41